MLKDSSVTSTMAQGPAKSRTSTEVRPRRGASSAGATEREVALDFGRARGALWVLATLAALPTPLAPFFGSSVRASVWPPLALAALWALVALGLDLWRRRAGGERALGGALLSDVIFLSALLGNAGAAQNPFTILYFVPMMLSTLLPPRFTGAVVVASILGFSTLLGVTAREFGPHAHHGHFFHHVVGMAVALGLAGALGTYFAHRIARSLARERALVARLNREKEQDRYATSLGTLAAGAAHELGTPLGTVQLLAGELPHMDEEERNAAARRIEREVQRMKTILHGMTSSQLSAQVLSGPEAWRTEALAAELEADGKERVLIRIGSSGETTQPRVVLAQILRELVQNALRATEGSSSPVEVSLEIRGEELVCCVRDEGPGMSEDQAERALEPFVSDTGGRGLGLFLAQVHARQLGGKLELESALGRGTLTRLIVPLELTAAGDES